MLTQPVSKRNHEIDENEDLDEAVDLPLNLQDASIPATGFSEFERGWVVVNDMTKKADEKRKREIAEREAARLVDSNTSMDARKKGKPREKTKRDDVTKKA